jgi:hypothetical protein
MDTKPAGGQRSLAALIDSYCRRVSPGVLDEHPGNSVSSPLGIWLLLAACSTAASGDTQRDLEEVLGCPAAEAMALLSQLLEAPPPALHTAIAVWVSSGDRTSPLVGWTATLPPEVERGPIPSQEDADAWADRHTEGLIREFPAKITARTRLILASALATKVTWHEPMEVVPAKWHVRDSSPWADRVDSVLYEGWPAKPSMLARTDAAGVVAVHFAVATEGLAVVSVAAEPSIERPLVFEAAYEIVRRCRDDDLVEAQCSLFDLPLGEGHSWHIDEEPFVYDAEDAEERSEQIVSAVLAAWSVQSRIDLTSSGFGVKPALEALLGLVAPSSLADDYCALQSAVASFGPTGFEAAALTTLLLGATPRATEGVSRWARLIFDHPYAAVAVAGTTSDFERPGPEHTETFCLPLFSVWVAEPGEPEVVVD